MKRELLGKRVYYCYSEYIFEVYRYEKPNFNNTNDDSRSKKAIEKQNNVFQELTKRLTVQNQQFIKRELKLLRTRQTKQESQTLIFPNTGDES
ncbi:hypothetical protein ACQCWI_04845 [Bacillus thuringiensis]|uniref:hypothetical protein n=1 Tax=Bacillus thuringiensis TaxID=1428 RepID=UPI003CEB875B